MNMQDMLISSDEIVKSHKGREKQIIKELADELRNVRPGFAMKLAKTFPNVPKDERDKVSAIIRKHWKFVRDDKPSIYYDPNGIPQVSIKGK